MTLTKEILVSAFTGANGYSWNQAAVLVEPLIDTIKSKLAAGEDGRTSGSGKLYVKEKRGGGGEILRLERT
jgi:nucleoid DNA-binding protein